MTKQTRPVVVSGSSTSYTYGVSASSFGADTGPVVVTPYEIPLTPNAQRFDVTLAGVDYFMLLVWNRIARCWVLDISDENGKLLVGGIPLITGVDLLAQYAYLGFGGGLLCVSDKNEAIPSYSELGKTGHLYFVTVK